MANLWHTLYNICRDGTSHLRSESFIRSVCSNIRFARTFGALERIAYKDALSIIFIGVWFAVPGKVGGVGRQLEGRWKAQTRSQVDKSLAALAQGKTA